VVSISLSSCIDAGTKVSAIVIYRILTGFVPELGPNSSWKMGRLKYRQLLSSTPAIVTQDNKAWNGSTLEQDGYVQTITMGESARGRPGDLPKE